MNPIRNGKPQRRRPPGGPPNAPHRQGRSAPPGNANRNYERYLALAREAALSGDTVEMENCYQHAEHYFRLMNNRG